MLVREGLEEILQMSDACRHVGRPPALQVDDRVSRVGASAGDGGHDLPTGHPERAKDLARNESMSVFRVWSPVSLGCAQDDRG